MGDWTTYPTTRCRAEKDVNFQEYRYDNLKFACFLAGFVGSLWGLRAGEVRVIEHPQFWLYPLTVMSPFCSLYIARKSKFVTGFIRLLPISNFSCSYRWYHLCARCCVHTGSGVSSTMCSKHVQAYNKLIIKQEFVH